MPEKKYEGRVSPGGQPGDGKSRTKEYIAGVPSRDLTAAEYTKYSSIIDAHGRGSSIFKDKAGKPSAPAPGGKPKASKKEGK